MLKIDKDQPRLGILKVAFLLAKKHPELIDEGICCTSFEEVAEVFGLDVREQIHDTAVRLLNEWIENRKGEPEVDKGG